jgi:hypothetical protein
MSVLAEAASRRDTVTYEQIAKRIEPKLHSKIANVQIGGVVGNMMDRIYKFNPEAPPINALCVKVGTKLPGSGVAGYIKRYLPKVNYKKLTDPQKREVLLPVFNDIFDFKEWSRIARKAFNVSVPNQKVQEKTGESDGKARRLGFGGPAESDEHRHLKEYVANNPRLFGAPKGCKKGIIEKRLKSFDEVDVWFLNIGEQLAIEVKSLRSNELDLERGIFQCVKYRAVLQAEAKVQKINSRIRSCLVSERKLVPRLAQIADALDVEVSIASRGA